jgi:hypothetical protein
MFEVFNNESLNEWNSLTKIQQQNYIDNGEVNFAVDIEITIFKNTEIIEEHKYYRIDKYSKNLLQFIDIKDIKENEIILNINNSIVSLNIGEEKNIEFGMVPYKNNIRIKTSNLIIGRIVEL